MTSVFYLTRIQFTFMLVLSCVFIIFSVSLKFVIFSCVSTYEIAIISWWFIHRDKLIGSQRSIQWSSFISRHERDTPVLAKLFYHLIAQILLLPYIKELKMIPNPCIKYICFRSLPVLMFKSFMTNQTYELFWI